MVRWLVERTRDVFDDVGADGCLFHDSGALIFHNEPELTRETFVLAYAPGEWLTVCEEEEAG